MEINKITGKSCKTTRPLWEDVFYEDSVQFTDYYFENKAEKNIGYVIGQAPYDAMMFRTPYMLQIGKAKKEISYIVGVATRKECRHRGCMRALLMHSFQEMYQEKNPFTFLMPANPAIYEPFDFQYIYERDVWELKEPERVIGILEAFTAQGKENLPEWKYNQVKYELRAAEFEEENQSILEITQELAAEKKEDRSILEITQELAAEKIADNNLKKYKSTDELQGLYSVRNLRKQYPQFPILNLLAEFSNRYLEEHYHIYVHRDASYYEMQLKESEAQNGDIYVFLKQGNITAFFLYAKEGEEIFIQEVMEEKEGILDFLQKTEKKKPVIMARIIHLEEMMKLVCSKENTSMVIEIEDDLISENAGIFQWEMTSKGSTITRIGIKSNDCKEMIDRKASEINVEAANNVSAGIIENNHMIPEISMHIRDFASRILTGVFLNEIV